MYKVFSCSAEVRALCGENIESHYLLIVFPFKMVQEVILTRKMLYVVAALFHLKDVAEESIFSE